MTLTIGGRCRNATGAIVTVLAYTSDPDRVAVETLTGDVYATYTRNLTPYIDDVPTAPAEVWINVYLDGLDGLGAPNLSRKGADDIASPSRQYVAHYRLASVEAVGRPDDDAERNRITLVEETSPGQTATVSKFLAGRVKAH